MTLAEAVAAADKIDGIVRRSTWRVAITFVEQDDGDRRPVWLCPHGYAAGGTRDRTDGDELVTEYQGASLSLGDITATDWIAAPAPPETDGHSFPCMALPVV